jgi:predicted metal-binding protein
VKDRVRSDWRRAVLVCGKCARRAGGFGPDARPLGKALRARLGGGKGRRAAVGVVEVKCLGVCPKRAVVVVDAARPDRWRLVRSDADFDALAADLSDVPDGDQA